MRKSIKTEEKIIKVALQLFVQKGYHATSIRDITEHVGVTKGAFYSHFTSKGKLLLRIIEMYERSYVEKMIESVSAYEGNALEKLHHVISFSSAFALKNVHLTGFLFVLSPELNEDVDFRSSLAAIYRKYNLFISELISMGIEAGLFKKTLAPNLTAHTFISLQDGVFHQWVLNRSHLNGKQFVKNFRAIFMEGLLVKH
jgi:AcrR family transcriptional regulator